ncbi:molybdopterin converting factor subunit 1 [Pseudahrensia aquimaris]|uniref:Molybdopterin converting factor subunit 1 n=1 Tax=Pseudahrensia aquimaris TaxID=744461 RepID=A0ABW3FB38_9HYPH
MVKLIYFSWVRERVGFNEEEIELPDGVATVRDLLGWLRTRGQNYQHALEFPEIIRVALDQEHANHEDTVGTAKEIALFPPMTGG